MSAQLEPCSLLPCTLALSAPTVPHGCSLHRSLIVHESLSLTTAECEQMTCILSLCRKPVPHSAEQLLQDPSLLGGDKQSGCRPCQCVVCLVVGHAVPPCCTCATTGRVRSTVLPPPWKASQDPQSPTVQSTGQNWLLHSLLSTSDGHWMPTAFG